MTASSLNQGLLKVGLLGPAVSNYAPQNQSTVSPLGELRVENPASQLFIDTFDSGTLDLINKWTRSNGGTGVLPSNSVGATVLNGGTTLNSFSKLTTLLPVLDPGSGLALGSFKPTEPGFLLFNSRCNLQAPIPVNNLINWGFGTSPGSPTIASPITQFIGYEVTITGKLQAVVYQSGTRVLIQDLSVALPNNPPGTTAPQPTDSSAHKYFVYFRGDIAYWCIDDKDNVVAQYQTGANGPDVNTLPLLFQIISNAGSAATLQVNAATVGDTAHTAGTQFLSNGIGLEAQKTNTDANAGLVTISAAGASTLNSADFINTSARGVVVGINTTIDTAGAYTVAIQGKDIVSGQYYTIPGAISASIATTGFTTLSVYPGIVAAANAAVSWPLPRTWRVQVVVTTGPITATIGAALIN